ncbi:MAG: leucine-rich repeat domain-containing protein [Ruminococcus sp.]|nr:leucine-rich repeat domain-containing protein [Ruminococcus sp.]
MTKLEKIEEIIREYENGCNAEITAEDIIKGIDTVLSDSSGIYESEIEKAKKAITDFCDREYDTQADLDNLYNVNFAYTTITDDEIPLQVSADLINCKINYTLGECILAKSESYSSLTGLAEDISNSSFDDWVTVYDLPSYKINEYLAKNNPFIIEGTTLAKYTGREGRIVVPEGITHIQGGAFAKNKSIKDVMLPEGVITIGSSAFSDCSELERISLPESLIGISEYAFFNCTNLTKINIPDEARIIQRHAFYGCQNLKNVSIPANCDCDITAFPHTCKVTHSDFDIEDGELIKYCGSSQIITVPDNVDTIGTDAFLKCEAKEIILPTSVHCIDDWAFTGCTNLEHIDIPDSVSTIGKGAFDGCTNLKSASIGRTTAVFSGDSFPLRCKVTRRNSEPKRTREMKI